MLALRQFSLSVIVPVYNDWHRIPVLLECLAGQTLPRDQFEILLIDNGSDAVQPAPRLPTNARILHCSTPGSYAARNHGIEHARGTWLAFTDADCRPRPDWLENLLEQGRQKSEQQGAACLLAGRIHMQPSGPKPGPWEMHDLVKGIPQAWYVSRGYAATANLLVPASLARALGGFDAARYSGGDADFCRRAVAAGAGLHYVASAIVDHPARATWPELANKYRRIKGAQITQGSPRQRLIWGLRSFLPPVIAWARFLKARQWSWRHRLTACAVQVPLWGVDMAETLRLVLWKAPRR